MRAQHALKLIRAAALASVVAASPGWAQQADLLLELRPPHALGDRGGFVTVRERRQPQFEPVAVRAAGLELMPRAGAETILDSNIFAASESTEDVILRFGAGLDVTRATGLSTLRAEAEVDRRQYIDRGELSSTDYGLGLSLRRALPGDAAIVATARAGRETESLTEPAAPLDNLRPGRYDYITASLGAVRRFGRLAVAARAGIDDRSYAPGLDAFGDPIDQSFRNRLVALGEIGAEYDLGPDRSLFALASFNLRDYRNPRPDEPLRDSRGVRVEAGAALMLTPLIRSRFSIGYFAQDFRDPLYETARGLAARARIDYAVTPLVTLALTGSRGVEESSTLGSGAYVATRVGAQADYELLRNLVLSAFASYERDRFQSIDRRYSIKRAGLSGRYRLSPRLRLDAEYEAGDQDSLGLAPGRDFVRHQLTFGVTLEGM